MAMIVFLRVLERRPAVVFSGVMLFGAVDNCLAVPVTTAAGSSPTGQWPDFWMMVIFASVALVFSFLCSIAEAVLLSVSPGFVADLKLQGKSGGRRLEQVKHNLDRSLAAVLTLNTIAHTVGAGGAGAYAAKFFGQNRVGIAMAILTLLILFLSEIIPKTLGATFWRVLATPTAYFVQFLNFVLYPLLVVSEWLTRFLTGGKRLHGMTREEFTALADLGAAGGELDIKESRIVKNLLKFPLLRAEDIMTPRTVVFALQQDQTVHAVIDRVREASFSRIPLFGENRDDISGFVLRTDVLLNERESDGQATLVDMKRELRAVDQSTSLSHVLEELLDNRAHILLVVDPYGGMQGIVTLEDVVETLIGMEIVDEIDKIDDMRKLARSRWTDRIKRAGIDVRQLPAEPDAQPPDHGS